MKKLTGHYANGNIIKVNDKEILILYGRQDKRKFIEAYVKSRGYENTLKLIMMSLNFNIDFPTDKEEAYKKVKEYKDENKDVWIWHKCFNDDDPIKCLFDSSLTFERK